MAVNGTAAAHRVVEVFVPVDVPDPGATLSLDHKRRRHRVIAEVAADPASENAAGAGLQFQRSIVSARLLWFGHPAVLSASGHLPALSMCKRYRGAHSPRSSLFGTSLFRIHNAPIARGVLWYGAGRRIRFPNARSSVFALDETDEPHDPMADQQAWAKVIRCLCWNRRRDRMDLRRYEAIEETELQHHCQADDFRTAVEALERIRFGHGRTLASPLPRLKANPSDNTR